MPKPNEYGNTRMFMTNTRGSDDFMSTRQFETFYWPTFKKLVRTLIERERPPAFSLKARLRRAWNICWISEGKHPRPARPNRYFQGEGDPQGPSLY